MKILRSSHELNDRLTRLEAFAQQMVEGNLARLFGARLDSADVVGQLVRAIADNAQSLPNDVRRAPDLITVYLSVADHAALTQAVPDLADRLAVTMREVALRAGYQMDTMPFVTVEASAAVAVHTITISAQHSRGTIPATQPLPALGDQLPAQPRPAQVVNPHLILSSASTYPLNRSVINVGRRTDNHLVLDDQRVSRVHAQLRLRLGHYVIYDLNSTGGTLVNNQRVTEAILQHGDVISFAGVTAVYVEDGSGLHRVPTDTQMRARMTSDEPSEAAYEGASGDRMTP